MYRKIYNLLLKEYGEQGWWPCNSIYSQKFKDRERSQEEIFEIIVGAILTQNTSWTNVEKALSSLRKNNVLNRKKLVNLSDIELTQMIKSAGYYNQKVKKIREFLKFDKKINRENLLGIWGFGPETVDSILLYAYNKPIFVIDSYTKRIFFRIGLCSKDISYTELQDLFYKNLKKDYKIFNEYHALIVEHAKQHCSSKPKCAGCCLNEVCKKKFLVISIAA